MTRSATLWAVCCLCIIAWVVIGEVVEWIL